MIKFDLSGKKITVFPSAAENAPIIYLNTFGGEGERVYNLLREAACSDFSLVAIGGLDWNHDTAPWDIPPISKNDTPCTGGADDYLRLLTEEIVPKAESFVQKPIRWRGLAGYSLAGLLAVYAVYKTDCFSRIGSMSGSLWFPDFKEYVFTGNMRKKPEYLYFSLGDKESRTRNPYLKTVQKNTKEIQAYCQKNGINTTYEMNLGGHYQNGAERIAAGILWLLKQ